MKILHHFKVGDDYVYSMAIRFRWWRFWDRSAEVTIESHLTNQRGMFRMVDGSVLTTTADGSVDGSVIAGATRIVSGWGDGEDHA